MEVLGKKEKKELISNVQFYSMRRFPLRHCALFMGAPTGAPRVHTCRQKLQKNRNLSFLPNCHTPPIKSSELAILSS